MGKHINPRERKTNTSTLDKFSLYGSIIFTAIPAVSLAAIIISAVIQ